jgi:hypothetical protein
MMALADFTMYVAVLATIGPVPLAVTTNLNINFLRKPATHDPDRRLPATQDRQAAGGRRGHDLLGRHGRGSRSCHLDLLDPRSYPDLIDWYNYTYFITI